MLVHREVDEKYGKRDKAWIKTLRKRATNSVDDTSNESFSSSTDPAFNKAMKERALEKILPSLFDIAEAHESYVVQHGLFEGSGNVDPEVGKEVTWERAPRPDRTAFRKKARYAPSDTSRQPSEQALDTPASGDETEVEDATMTSSFSSVQSPSGEEDVKMITEPSPMHATSHAEYSSSQVVPTTPHQTHFDRSMNGLCLGETVETKMANVEAARFPGMQTNINFR